MFYYIKLYWHLQVANLRSKSIYPFNFIIGILSVILLGIANIMFSWIITERVPRIEGYGFYEMVFIFSLWLVPHSIFVMFFRQIWEIDNIIKNGEFDRYFLRPLSTLFQFFTSRFEIAGIGDFIAGLIGFFICFNHITDWNSLKLINLFIVVVSGLVIEWSIYTIIGCTSFWTLQSTSLRTIVRSFFEQFTRFPLTIYGNWIQSILTFVIPIAFINFYPSYLFFGDVQDAPFSSYLIYASPIVAILMSFITYTLWIKAINNYKGAGS